MGPNTSFIEYVELVRRRRFLFFSVLVGFVGLVMAATYHMEPVYEATTTLMIDAEPGSRFTLLPVQQLSRRSIAINNDLEVLRSRRLLSDVVERLESAGELRQFAHLRARGANPVDWLRKSIAVRLIKATDVIELKAKAGDPAEATLIADTIAKVYIDASRREARSRDRRVKTFLAEQVEHVRARLAVTESNLSEFQQQHGVVSIDDETEAAIKQLAEFDAALRTNQVELTSRRERLRLLTEQRQSAALGLGALNAQVSGPLTATLRNELSGVMALYARFQAEGYSPEHEKMQEIERKVERYKQRLADEARALVAVDRPGGDPVGHLDRLTELIIAEEVEAAALEARNHALEQVVQRYQHQLDGLPAKAHLLAQLRRAAEVEEAILVMLHKRYEEARIEEAGVAGRGRVIDPALAPKRPVRPRPLLSLMLGVVFGLGLAFGACVLSRPLQRHIDSPEMAQQLTGLQILGQIPIIPDEDAEQQGHSRLMRKFLGSTDGPTRSGSAALLLGHSHGSDVVEAYRALRTMLQFASSEAAPRTMLVTSAGPGDGKTTNAANLALTFAASGRRVLLVDADMRKPNIHNLFGLDNQRGLREALSGEVSVVEAVRRSTVSNLDILTAGGKAYNPSELLASEVLIELIQQLRERYEYLVIDSPPVLPVTDPAILSTRVDATLFVVRDRLTPKAALEYGISVLRCLPITLTGIIYNEDHSEDRGNYYYGYRRGYSYRRGTRGGDRGGQWVSSLPSKQGKPKQSADRDHRQDGDQQEPKIAA